MNEWINEWMNEQMGLCVYIKAELGQANPEDDEVN